MAFGGEWIKKKIAAKRASGLKPEAATKAAYREARGAKKSFAFGNPGQVPAAPKPKAIPAQKFKMYTFERDCSSRYIGEGQEPVAPAKARSPLEGPVPVERGGGVDTTSKFDSAGLDPAKIAESYLQQARTHLVIAKGLKGLDRQKYLDAARQSHAAAQRYIARAAGSGGTTFEAFADTVDRPGFRPHSKTPTGQYVAEGGQPSTKFGGR